MGTQKKKLAYREEHVAKKKVVTLKVLFESNINGVIEGIADVGMLSLPPFKRYSLCSQVKASLLTQRGRTVGTKD